LFVFGCGIDAGNRFGRGLLVTHLSSETRRLAVRQGLSAILLSSTGSFHRSYRLSPEIFNCSLLISNCSLVGGKGKNFLHIYATFSPQDSTPLGLKSKPHGLESTPHGLESKPRGLESTPRGLESKPRGLESKPRGLESTPHGLKFTPLGVAFAINTKKPAKHIFQQCFTANKPHFRRIFYEWYI
jgi:hypothetical protein